MIRADMISTVGRAHLTSNIENDEYSYRKAFSKAALQFVPIRNAQGRAFEKLDIRFVKENVTVLVETKQCFTDADEEQLSAYVEYEKLLTGNKTVAILANTTNDNVKVWRGVVSDSDYMPNETALRTMDEYVDFYTSKINNKEKVMQNTYKLNELLHRHSIPEKLRSQFVGTCLLALKNGLEYSITSLSAAQIRIKIKEVLEALLSSDMNKAEKLTLLNRNVLEGQYVRQLDVAAFREILKFIDDNILPFINDKSTSGQDLLNLFFVTFNKYVGKSDKNQAFTPDHITDFMSKITGVNKHSIVLDPCCGSGSFLVRAMTQALDDCATAAEQNTVKKHQIFGIEFDENVYGLATTNMLIHSDGNSNIRQGSCFALTDWIKEAKPNVILMNPPYNGQRIHLPQSYVSTWPQDKKEDPSKGLFFVKFIADTLNAVNIQAKLAVLLPVACAIGTSGEISRLKKEILKENTLDAVFTLPNEIFYPGASASACCMVFKIGTKHSDISNPDTFFGYYKDDGFKKKKNLGRVEQIDSATGKSKWVSIENKWIEAYRNRCVIDGFSSTHEISGDDEWLCEAYMKTDYSQLRIGNFIVARNKYLAYLIANGSFGEFEAFRAKTMLPGIKLDITIWKEFRFGDLISNIYKARAINKDDLTLASDFQHSIRYITRTEENNGCELLADVRMVDEQNIENGNAISIGDTTATCFYQDEKFITGDHMVVVRADNWLNKYTALFVLAILNNERYKYSYGRAFLMDRIKETIVKLPATPIGSPDWQFMENYIKALPYGDRLD